MFNPMEHMIDEFISQLQAGYHRTFGGMNPDYADIIGWAGSMALENIANSDALYHNVEHTVLVTMVGQEILRGKHLREGGVTGQDWLNFVVSLVCHDIGYVKGVCQADGDGRYATGKGGRTIALPPGATDAALTPYHVDRAKLFIDERFAGHKLINARQIKRNIELTRFPVPEETDEQDTEDFAGFLRASDLIGQLSDPRYLKKVAALFHEFEETGVNEKLNYTTPADLRECYPKFYWNSVYPFIKDIIPFLSLTQNGKQILASLYSNVFVVEHGLPSL
ncbi:MAG: metal-dependent phosphohydrolase [Candidatus Riflebacteria bacterium]|nr:metal-dependent phosphohydrolase [Candidatus Riflebacteria bacterium]